VPVAQKGVIMPAQAQIVVERWDPVRRTWVKAAYYPADQRHVAEEYAANRRAANGRTYRVV
jgi:hypothetical protein